MNEFHTQQQIGDACSEAMGTIWAETEALLTAHFNEFSEEFARTLGNFMAARMLVAVRSRGPHIRAVLDAGLNDAQKKVFEKDLAIVQRDRRKAMFGALVEGLEGSKHTASELMRGLEKIIVRNTTIRFGHSQEADPSSEGVGA